MQGVGGVEEHGRQADRGKGGGNFAGHDAAFANARHHKFCPARAAAQQQFQGRFHLLATQLSSGGGDGGGFFLEAAAQGRSWALGSR